MVVFVLGLGRREGGEGGVDGEREGGGVREHALRVNIFLFESRHTFRRAALSRVANWKSQKSLPLA